MISHRLQTSQVQNYKGVQVETLQTNKYSPFNSYNILYIMISNALPDVAHVHM